MNRPTFHDFDGCFAGRAVNHRSSEELGHLASNIAAGGFGPARDSYPCPIRRLNDFEV